MLRPILRDLAQHIRIFVQEWRDSGQLEMFGREYVLRPDLSLRYSVDPNMIYQLPVEHGEEKLWDWKNLDSFVHQKVESSSEYKQVIGQLSTSERNTYLLQNFCRRIANESLPPDSEPRFALHIETLIRDLHEVGQDYIALIWLTGVIPQEELIKVSDRLLFRKPRHEDLRERLPNETIHSAHAFQNQTPFSCIAELQVPASWPGDVQMEIDRLIKALRLFRLGAVSSSRIDMVSQSFSVLGRARLGNSLMPTIRLEYGLSQSDASDLERFLKVITPAIPTVYQFPEPEPDFLSTAFDWYGDALLAIKPIEGTIASAVACLEALFLGDNPKTDIGYCLKQRVAALLARFGKPALQTWSLLSKAYDVRSRYVHGSVPTRNKKLTQQQLSQMFHATADFARLACLVMIQLVRIHKKTPRELLDTLNHGLIDDAARLKFNEWCSGVVYGHNLLATADDSQKSASYGE